MNVPRRYVLVRVISFVLKLLAWLALLGGIAAAIVAVAGSNSGGPAFLQVLRSVGMAVGLVVGIVWFLQLFAFGSILSLLVDIEENTRVLAGEPPVTVERP